MQLKDLSGCAQALRERDFHLVADCLDDFREGRLVEVHGRRKPKMTRNNQLVCAVAVRWNTKFRKPAAEWTPSTDDMVEASASILVDSLRKLARDPILKQEAGKKVRAHQNAAFLIVRSSGKSPEGIFLHDKRLHIVHASLLMAAAIEALVDHFVELPIPPEGQLYN